MKWAAVTVVAAALFTGACNDTFIQGTVIGNLPGDEKCKTASSGRTTLLRVQSSSNHVDPNDPNYTWKPTVRDTCVTPEIAKQYPVGSHYAA